MKYIVLGLLMGCASKHQISEWTKGCMVGVVDSFQRIADREWDDSHTPQLYMHCSELESMYGKDN